jgi:hypothetical protein
MSHRIALANVMTERDDAARTARSFAQSDQSRLQERSSSIAESVRNFLSKRNGAGDSRKEQRAFFHAGAIASII